MNLKTKYIFFVSVFTAIIIILSLPFLNTQPVIFVLIELMVLLSIVFSIVLYRSLVKPVILISGGIDSIKEKDFNSKLLKVGQKDMDQLIEVYNRMIEQLREERILHQEQNLFLEKLIEASPSGIIILNHDSTIISLNPSAEKILNVLSSTVVFKSIKEVSGPFFETIKRMDDNSSETVKTSGTEILRLQKSHFIDKGCKHSFILIEELTEEIRKTEKESYEKIIRMMSHEINNSIGAVNSILNSFINFGSHLKSGDKIDFENAIQVAIDRNNKLNKFMGNFADVVRIPPPAKTECNLGKLISDVIALMSPICNQNNIVMEYKSEKNIGTVYLDIQQIEQVLLNIIKNSVESIGTGGIIFISVQLNDYFEISIQDNGKGINEETKNNLFTPFYSTKTNGQGIGLTLIREVLNNHGYDFSLTTNENGLTEFKIRGIR